MKTEQKWSWAGIYYKEGTKEWKKQGKKTNKKPLVYRSFFCPTFLLAFSYDFIWRPLTSVQNLPLTSEGFASGHRHKNSSEQNCVFLWAPMILLHRSDNNRNNDYFHFRLELKTREYIEYMSLANKRGAKALKGLIKTNILSIYFNLNCFQAYIKLLCFQQCSSPSTCFVLQSLGKQVVPLCLKLLYWSTSLTCSVILLFYLDQC